MLDERRPVPPPRIVMDWIILSQVMRRMVNGEGGGDEDDSCAEAQVANFSTNSLLGSLKTGTISPAWINSKRHNRKATTMTVLNSWP